MHHVVYFSVPRDEVVYAEWSPSFWSHGKLTRNLDYSVQKHSSRGRWQPTYQVMIWNSASWHDDCYPKHDLKNSAVSWCTGKGSREWRHGHRVDSQQLTTAVYTFACLLWRGVVGLPSVMAIWQVRTLKPGLVPHVKVPENGKYNKWWLNTSVPRTKRDCFGANMPASPALWMSNMDIY